MSTPVGTLLGGRYRLDERVGAGGMSTVYRAFDTVLERQVAIKLMHREIASDSDQLERFRREARAVARLNHPHIVTVIDAGEDGDPEYPRPFIVFEYVDGETLKDRIRRGGPMPVAEAAAYAIEICRALGCAHSQEIVHRDVKPQNVMIDAEGRAKITDFGIARTLTEEGLTADGRVLGTTDYVSPEQALGHRVTGQSDLYSLGVVLYEMLTGDVPFHGETPVAVAMRHVREEVPDVLASRRGVSAALAAVVDRATAKDLARRYPDANAMEAELEDALAVEASRSGHATGETTAVLRTLPAPARRRLPFRLRVPLRWLVIVGALLVVGTVAALLILAGRTHRGTGSTPGVSIPAQLAEVSLGQAAAHPYNPFGSGGQEDAEQIGNVLDRDTTTTWSTEHYIGDNLNKPGTGFYIDAYPRVLGRELILQTPTPGFDLSVWVSNGFTHQAQGDPTPLASRGWSQVAGVNSVTGKETIPLDLGGRPYRYYLVWITKLPPNQQSAAVSEVTLLR